MAVDDTSVSATNVSYNSFNPLPPRDVLATTTNIVSVSGRVLVVDNVFSHSTLKTDGVGDVVIAGENWVVERNLPTYNPKLTNLIIDGYASIGSNLRVENGTSYLKDVTISNNFSIWGSINSSYQEPDFPTSGTMNVTLEDNANTFIFSQDAVAGTTHKCTVRSEQHTLGRILTFMVTSVRDDGRIKDENNIVKFEGNKLCTLNGEIKENAALVHPSKTATNSVLKVMAIGSYWHVIYELGNIVYT